MCKMAKPSSRSASVYFTFLIFVLVCITFLIVVLIIATALQINKVRSDIIQASDRNETAHKINSIMELYNSFTGIINSHVGNYSKIFDSLNGDIKSYGSQIAYQYKLVTNEEKTRIKKYQSEHISFSNNVNMIFGLCNASFYNSDRLSSKFVVAESTWSNFNTQSGLSKFYDDLRKIILPASSTFLVNSNFNTSLFSRKTKPVPGGDYLAIHDNKPGNYYEARPNLTDFTKIKLKTTSASNGRFIIEQPGSNVTNKNLSVRVTTPNIQLQTKFDQFAIRGVEITN